MIVNKQTTLKLGTNLIRKLYKGAELIYNYVADIYYLTIEGKIPYFRQVDGTMIITNQGNFANLNDGLLYAGRAVELGATNDLPIPTHVDGYLTYHNIDTNTITQETTDGTDKVFNDVTLNNILTHKDELDAISLANIQANPNLLAELGINGNADGVNITLDATDSYYSVSEDSGADVYDARVAGNDTTISNYTSTIRANADQLNTGLQTTCLELDGAGVPVSYTDTELMVYDDTLIDTQWTPDVEEYSIEQTVTGELQDFGSDLLRIDPCTLDNSDATATVEFTAVDANGFDLAVTSVGTSSLYPRVIKDLTIAVDSGANLAIYFEAVVHSGTAIINSVNVGGLQVTTYTVVNGGNYIPITTVTSNKFARLYFRGTTLFDVSITNWEVKELTTKTQRTETRVITHEEGVLGRELVVNGDFESGDTGWVHSSGVVLADGKATFDGSIPLINLRQGTLIIGKTYAYSFEVVEYTQETIRLTIGGVALVNATAVGVYTGTVTAIADATNFGLYLVGLTAFIGAIDNVSVKEVLTQDKYYIDTVEQTITPPLPSPTTTLKLTNTPVIGYEDTIDEINYFAQHAHSIEI